MAIYRINRISTIQKEFARKDYQGLDQQAINELKAERSDIARTLLKRRKSINNIYNQKISDYKQALDHINKHGGYDVPHSDLNVNKMIGTMRVNNALPKYNADMWRGMDYSDALHRAQKEADWVRNDLMNDTRKRARLNQQAELTGENTFKKFVHENLEKGRKRRKFLSPSKLVGKALDWAGKNKKAIGLTTIGAATIGTAAGGAYLYNQSKKTEIQDNQKKFSSKIEMYKEFSSSDKDSTNVNPALIGGAGSVLTLGAMGLSDYKINKAAKDKLKNYENRSNIALNNEKIRLMEAGNKEVEASKLKTKNALNEGRKSYKKTRKDVIKGIKQAKQEYNASYDKAADAIRKGANEVTTGVKMDLPTGQKLHRSETMGYGINNNSQREWVANHYGNKKAHEINNNTINRETKNTLANLKFRHQQSQKNIVKSGIEETEGIMKRVNENIKSATDNTLNKIKNRKESLQKAAKKVKNVKRLKIGTIGLIGTGAATAGALAYNKFKNKN